MDSRLPTSDRESEAKERKLWSLQKGLSWVAVVVLSALVVPFLVEHLFQPLGSRHFLRLAANVQNQAPYAYALGLALALYFAFMVWKSKDWGHNRQRLQSSANVVKFTILLLLCPALGFWTGQTVVTLWIPLVQHQMADQMDAAVPFTINGFEFGRYCRGVSAVNALFSDDKLCGVKLPGQASEWEGRTIIVTGRQSHYGLSMNGYRVGPRT
jgi:hypothetical protein